MKSSQTSRLLIIILFTSLVSAQTDPAYNYNDFYVQFQRQYDDSEKQKHQNSFNKNYAKYLQAKKTNPHLEVNKFMDWTDEQLSVLLSFKPPIQSSGESQNQPRSLGAVLGATAPPTLDYRALGKVSPIKDQGGCGSCWAFASTACFESQILMTGGNLYDLSQQYVLQCTVGSTCAGGYPDDANVLLNNTGAPLQTDYPYKQTDAYYKNLGNPICTNTSNYIKLSQSAKNLSYVTGVTDAFLMDQLTNYGPFVVGIGGGNTNFGYVGSTGIVDNCPSSVTIDHAVLLVGYTTDRWIIKNSWGTWWGDQGYAYISKLSNCGITRYVDLFEVTASTPPPPPPPNTSQNISITVNMSDTMANGWGCTLGIKQNGVIVANFTLGKNLATGSKTFNVSDSYIASVVVVNLGTAKTRQVGFTIFVTSNSTILYKRSSGTSFYSTTVFTTFCLATCLSSSLLQSNLQSLKLKLTDSQGDGWTGNSIEFRQNENAYSFGLDFTNGRQSQIYELKLSKFSTVKVVLKTIGSHRNQIGFQLINKYAKVIASWSPGKSFSPDTILAQFCLECLKTSLQTSANLQNQLSQSYTQTNNESAYVLTKLQIGLIAGICLLVVCLIGVIIAFSLYICRSKQRYILKMQVPPQTSSSVGSSVIE